MCLGTPGRVVELVDPDHGIAAVELAGRQRRVNVSLLPRVPDAGEWVLVHLGFAVETLEAGEAASTLEFLHELGEPPAYARQGTDQARRDR